MEATNLYTATIPPMMKALNNLSAILDKAATHAESKQLAWHPKGMHAESLLNDRLIFDQFPFKRQIQIACDNGAGGAARLAGVDVPSFPDEEKTLEELKARIDKAVTFMKSIKPEDVIGHEDRKVELRYWPGKQMTAFGYATEYLMPNFYFHVSAAYSILRKNGIEIGKTDYIGAVPFVS